MLMRRKHNSLDEMAVLEKDYEFIEKNDDDLDYVYVEAQNEQPASHKIIVVESQVDVFDTEDEDELDLTTKNQKQIWTLLNWGATGQWIWLLLIWSIIPKFLAYCEARSLLLYMYGRENDNDVRISTWVLAMFGHRILFAVMTSNKSQQSPSFCCPVNRKTLPMILSASHLFSSSRSANFFTVAITGCFLLYLILRVVVRFSLNLLFTAFAKTKKRVL